MYKFVVLAVVLAVANANVYQVASPVVYSSGLHHTVPVATTYTHGAVHTPTTYTHGVVHTPTTYTHGAVHTPVVYSTGVHHTVPVHAAKVVQTYKPVEQHGYKIVY